MVFFGIEIAFDMASETVVSSAVPQVMASYISIHFSSITGNIIIKRRELPINRRTS